MDGKGPQASTQGNEQESLPGHWEPVPSHPVPEKQDIKMSNSCKRMTGARGARTGRHTHQNPPKCLPLWTNLIQDKAGTPRPQDVGTEWEEKGKTERRK